MSKPLNILWISFEDTYPFYACYGDPVARTPRLDRLAEEGCLYENAISTAPVCAPARAAIITGMYATTMGAHHMRTAHTHPAAPELPTPYETVPPSEVKCVSEFLRARGYYCTNRLKTDYQFDSPVSAWDEHSLEAHWRNRPDPEQPFFAVFNWEETHESKAWEENDIEIRFDPEEVPVPAYLPDTPKVRRTLAKTYTLIEDNDRRLGMLLDQLEEDGLAEHTLVVHWSDHGPLPRGKRWLYDSGIKVPLILRWPGKVTPGIREDRVVSTLDLAPTMLSCCGLPVPPYMQGKVFLGNHEDPPRKYAFSSRDRIDTHYDRVRSVRSDRFKYIRNFYPYQDRFHWSAYLAHHPIHQEMVRLHLEGKLPPEQSQLFEPFRPVEELYDLRKDPQELTNLAGDRSYAGILTEMGAALNDWIVETGDLGAVEESEMVRRWWPEGKPPVTGTPVFIGLTSSDAGTEPPTSPAELTTPCKIQMSCSTQGASIVYRWDHDAPDTWCLYTHPLNCPPGTSTLTAKAVRLGYQPSPVARLELMPDPGD